VRTSLRFRSIAPLPALALSAMLIAACAGGLQATNRPSGSPGPSPHGSPGAALSAGELRLALIDQLGPRWYCDPDQYPVAHGDEQSNAIAKFPEVQAEGDTFRAVVAKLGLVGTTTFSDAQKLAIYQVWKPAVSIPLNPAGDRYRFEYLAQPAAGGQMGTQTTGTIADDGTITIESQAPAGAPNCPICLARGTPIDTPSGPVAVETLRLGDPVWTLDAAGRRVAGVVIALGSTPAPAGHQVIRVTLADRRTATASPGHPLADGRHVGEIRVGDVVDGSPVVAAESIAYRGGETFDLVASGDTGIYFAGGIPMGSTLLPSR
jgi:Hint domain